MNPIQKSFASIAMLNTALIVLLAGCDPSGESAVSTENQADVDQPGGGEQLLGDVAEFDGFTLRADVSPSDHLSDAMAQQYGIEAGPDLALLTVVILEKGADQQAMPVSGELSAHYEGPAGQATDIEMRAVEANERVSYVGTLDTSAQRVFQFVIEAQPQSTDQPLQMSFEAELSELEVD